MLQSRSGVAHVVARITDVANIDPAAILLLSNTISCTLFV
jgi:hypothetical protein